MVYPPALQSVCHFFYHISRCLSVVHAKKKTQTKQQAVHLHFTSKITPKNLFPPKSRQKKNQKLFSTATQDYSKGGVSYAILKNN